MSIGLVLNPISIVKARFESNHFTQDAYPTLWTSFRTLYKDGGLKGLFRGFSATALRDAPYAGLYLALYEQHKTWLPSLTHRHWLLVGCKHQWTVCRNTGDNPDTPVRYSQNTFANNANPFASQYCQRAGET